MEILSGVVESVKGSVIVLKCGDEKVKIDTKKNVVCVEDKVTVVMSVDCVVVMKDGAVSKAMIIY